MLRLTRCLLALHVVAASWAPECPCLTSSSSTFAAVQSAVTQLATDRGATNYTTTYGLEGCASYDAVDSSFVPACSTTPQPSYCSLQWCFVDQEKCDTNETLCNAAGGARGSDASPYCRSRDSVPSVVLPSMSERPRYSYQTCGALDMYR